MIPRGEDFEIAVEERMDKGGEYGQMEEYPRRATFILNRWRLDWREITTLDPLETFPENLITNLCWSYESNQIRKFHSLETLFKLHISI